MGPSCRLPPLSSGHRLLLQPGLNGDPHGGGLSLPTGVEEPGTCFLLEAGKVKKGGPGCALA